MKIREIRDLTAEELRDKERSLTEEYFKLHFRHGTGQLESPATLKQMRRDIARIKTILKQRGDREEI